MPAFTPHLNLELPGGGSLGIGGDDETADVDDLNQNFQKIDTWAETVDEKLDEFEGQAFYVGTEAERVAMVPPRLRDGIRFKVTNTQIEWDRYENAWRKLHGLVTVPAAAWTMAATSGTVLIAGRTASFTIPYPVDASEAVAVSVFSGGSGYTNAAGSSITRNEANTEVTVRLTQLGSHLQQSFQLLWQIVPIG